MRVIAGALGGRAFDSPGSQRTHPMSDKMRGALFNILGDIDGLNVLDAFAGSGALAYEALSRGAKSALLLESDKTAQQAIDQNIQALGLDGRAHLVKASANAWLHTNPDARFDLVLCDPPYDNLQETLIEHLAGCVESEGLLILSWPTGVDLLELPPLKLLEQHGYGDAQLAFYRQNR